MDATEDTENEVVIEFSRTYKLPESNKITPKILFSTRKKILKKRSKGFKKSVENFLGNIRNFPNNSLMAWSSQKTSKPLKNSGGVQKGFIKMFHEKFLKSSQKTPKNLLKNIQDFWKFLKNTWKSFKKLPFPKGFV